VDVIALGGGGVVDDAGRPSEGDDDGGSTDVIWGDGDVPTMTEGDAIVGLFVIGEGVSKVSSDDVVVVVVVGNDVGVPRTGRAVGLVGMANCVVGVAVIRVVQAFAKQVFPIPHWLGLPVGHGWLHVVSASFRVVPQKKFSPPTTYVVGFAEGGGVGRLDGVVFCVHGVPPKQVSPTPHSIPVAPQGRLHVDTASVHDVPQ